MDSTNPEDVLLFIENFDELVDTLETDEGAPRFKLIKALLAGDPAKKWKTILNEVGARNQNAFEKCIENYYHLIWIKRFHWIQKIGYRM